MNKEAIEQRKQELTNQMNAEQARANQLQNDLQNCAKLMNAIEGALLNCDWMLVQLNGEQNGDTNGNSKKTSEGSEGTPGTNGQDRSESDIDVADVDKVIESKKKSEVKTKSG